MGRLAPEFDIDRNTSKGFFCKAMSNTRMCRKSRVNVLEISFADKASLRTSVLAAFLSRCSVEADLSANLIDHTL